MFAKVENNTILEIGVRVPNEILDPVTDTWIELDTLEKMKTWGYYRVLKPQLPDVTKVYGPIEYDAQEDEVSYTIVDKVYSPLYDVDGTTVLKTALEVVQEAKIRQLDEVEEYLMKLALPFVIRKVALNDNWSNHQGQVFNDVYTQLGEWKTEINNATDVKLLDKKEFGISTLINKLNTL